MQRSTSATTGDAKAVRLITDIITDLICAAGKTLS